MGQNRNASIQRGQGESPANDEEAIAGNQPVIGAVGNQPPAQERKAIASNQPAIAELKVRRGAGRSEGTHASSASSELEARRGHSTRHSELAITASTEVEAVGDQPSAEGRKETVGIQPGVCGAMHCAEHVGVDAVGDASPTTNELHPAPPAVRVATDAVGARAAPRRSSAGGGEVTSREITLLVLKDDDLGLGENRRLKLVVAEETQLWQVEEFVQTKLALLKPVEFSLVDGLGARLIQEAGSLPDRARIQLSLKKNTAAEAITGMYYETTASELKVRLLALLG